MGSKSAGKYCREKEKKVGFWCSLPVCIITAVLFLPLGLILVFSRMYKKRMIRKGTRNVAIIVNLIVAVLFILIMMSDAPQGETIKATAQQENIKTVETAGGFDLSRYMGLTISECEDGMNVDFQGGGNNIYYVEQDGWFSDPVELFRCTFDDSGKLVRVHLKNSGDAGYTLFGVATTMDEETAGQVLQENGISFLCDNVWLCANGNDAVYKETSGWSYEIEPKDLQETILYANTIKNFTYQREDSEGAYYIGNGQMLEYYHDSFAEFAYCYGKLTDYQKTVFGEEANGRYIYLWGEVTSVASDGTVQVFCTDEEAQEELGLLFPVTGSAKLHLVSEQESEILNIRKGDIITAFGKISAESYTQFITGIVDLNDSIIVSINSREVDIPVFQRTIPYISVYGQSANASSAQEPTNSTEQSNDGTTRYDSYTTDQLIAAYEENKFRAEDTFSNSYIELTGRIHNFSAYGYHFYLNAMADDDYHDNIDCEFDSDLHLSKVADLQVGDIVTIRCKVTQVGGVTTSYSVEVIDFVETSNALPTTTGNRYELDFFTITLPSDWEEKYVLEHNYSVRSEYLVFYYKSEYKYYKETYSEPGGWPFAIEIRTAGTDASAIAGWDYVGMISTSEGYSYELYLRYPIDPQFMDGSYNIYLEDADGIIASIVCKDGYSISLFD